MLSGSSSGCERLPQYPHNPYLLSGETMSMRTCLCLLFAATACVGNALAARIPGLEPGPVELKSAGPLTFAGSGVLLVGDSKAAVVYAIDTEDDKVQAEDPLAIENLQQAVAESLGAEAENVSIGDLAVNPDTGNAFLSYTAGQSHGIVRIAKDGSIENVDLNKVDHARKALPNPPEDKVVRRGRRARNPRDQAITDLAFFDGKVIVSGLSAGDSPSSVIEFPFPFAENTMVTNVEIYHAAHGRTEEPAIQTFVPFTIDGEPNLLAGFTCTPLVKFPMDQLRQEDKVRGTTVAELGNRNQPIDMIVYEKDGATFVLMNNTARGMMKVSTENIGSNPGLTQKVEGGGTAGQSYEQIESLASVTHMDKLDDSHAVVIMGEEGEQQTLKTVELP